MVVDSPAKELALSEYERNRLRISDQEWQRYAQQWVGLAPDGTRIIAAASDLVALDRVLRGQGLHISQVALEYVYVENELSGGLAATGNA